MRDAKKGLNIAKHVSILELSFSRYFIGDEDILIILQTKSIHI